jgi:hypothetical protein
MSVTVDESIKTFDTTLEFAVICNDELVGTTTCALQTTGRRASAAINCKIILGIGIPLLF